jgi:hypothetical protein
MHIAESAAKAGEKERHGGGSIEEYAFSRYGLEQKENRAILQLSG